MDSDLSYMADVSGSGCQAIIPTKSDGSPKFNWCLVRLTDPDNAIGTDLFKLPEVNLSMTVRDIPQAKRQAIKNKLDSLGINTSWITLDSTFREIIKKVGLYLDVNFKELGESM